MRSLLLGVEEHVIVACKGDCTRLWGAVCQQTGEIQEVYTANTVWSIRLFDALLSLPPRVELSVGVLNIEKVKEHQHAKDWKRS